MIFNAIAICLTKRNLIGTDLETTTCIIHLQRRLFRSDLIQPSSVQPLTYHNVGLLELLWINSQQVKTAESKHHFHFFVHY